MRKKRRERERERHRQEILEAALTVFAERGYHRATMNEIARRAEFAVGTLYRFFPSKKALYEALVWERAQIFHQRIMVAFEELPPEPVAALETIIRVRLEAIKEQMVFVRVFLSELWEARFRGGLTKDLRRLYEEYLEALAQVLAELTPPGLSPRQLASLVDGLVSTLIAERIEADEDLPTPGEIMALLTRPLVAGGNHA